MKFSLRTAAAALALAILGTAWAAPAGASSAAKAWATPNLSAGYTPQGMTYWHRPGPNMVVMGEYRPGANSRLVAVDPRSGKVYGQVAVAESHLGGIAIVGDWLFVQDQPDVAALGFESIRRYRLSTFSAAIQQSHAAKGHPVYVKAAGVQQLAPWQWASFMTAGPHGTLYAGHHGVGVSARVYAYAVDQKSGLLTAQGYMLAPDNTQGMAFDGDKPVYASGGGHLTVGGVSLSLPSHAQGVVVIGGKALVAFEGGAKNVLAIPLT